MDIRLSQESYLITIGIEEKTLNEIIENEILNINEKILKLIRGRR